MNHIKLTDSARSIRIQIPGFSKVVPKQTISYGSVPFLIFGRKWGLNVYPHGLRPSSKDYGQRIDIYVHIWAKDSNETEAQFKTWVRENNLHFNLVITEPEPAALYRVESSESLWCDMEDEAGWWLFSLRASSRLLELTNDTLIVEIQFQPGPSTNTVPAIGPSLLGFSPLSDQRKLLPHIKDVANKNLKFPDPVRFRPFPTPYDPSLEVFFNNQTFSDLVVVAQGREIHLQQCFVSQKLPNWASIHKDIHADLETTLATTAPQSPNTFESSTKPSKSSTRLLIDSPYQVLHALFSFAYSGTLALDPTPDSYAHLYVLSERYGMDTLRRYCKRELHALLCPDAAVSLLCSLGGRSPTLQEFIVAYIIHNFTDVMASDGFKRLFFGPRVRHSRRLLAILRRMETRITVGDDARAHAAVTVSNVAAAVGLVTSPASEFSAVGSKLDWRRSMAFRSLLTNPEVADVHFLVEGRYIYAQKSVLSALSDFFLAMFSRSWAESSSENGPTIIEIPDFPYSTFYNMLLFLYVHEIEPPKSMVDTGLLYVIADKYQLLDLVRHAEHLLVRQLTSNNAPNSYLVSLTATNPFAVSPQPLLFVNLTTYGRHQGFGASSEIQRHTLNIHRF
ncbi:hypothetical protein BC829DRAFT_46865 [Chytridium lagenaria]|nr:hypothetical protein BC829DRAFT_46865 [Chytridium lagenaria]